MDILRAAARTFRNVGFAAAGMRDIAQAAELSPGNLYHYFRGKDELLFFCQNRSLDRLLDALTNARKAGGPIDGRLRDLAVSHVLCLIDEVEGSAAHLEVDALPPKLRQAIVTKRDRYERGVRTLVAQGIAERTFHAADATIATRAFLGALNWTAQWYRPEGAQAAPVVAGHVADFAIAGLGGHDQRTHRADRQRRTDRGRVRPVQNAARGAA